MTKEERIKYLKRLAKSKEGEALKEHFNELIEKMVDARGFSKEDFELDGKTNLKAAAALEKILRDLELLAKDKSSKPKNQYI